MLNIKIHKIPLWFYIDENKSGISFYPTIQIFNDNSIDLSERRVLLREAIKRMVKQINVLPIELGALRRSPVAAYVEVVFHGGYVRCFAMCGKDYEVQPDQKHFEGTTETMDTLSASYIKRKLVPSAKKYLTQRFMG